MGGSEKFTDHITRNMVIAYSSDGKVIITGIFTGII